MMSHKSKTQQSTKSIVQEVWNLGEGLSKQQSFRNISTSMKPTWTIRKAVEGSLLGKYFLTWFWTAFNWIHLFAVGEVVGVGLKFFRKTPNSDFLKKYHKKTERGAVSFECLLLITWWKLMLFDTSWWWCGQTYWLQILKNIREFLTIREL